jgi:hypothetical protein
MIRCLIALTLVFSVSTSHAHEYQTSVPEIVSWGSKVTWASKNLVWVQPGSLDAGACNGEGGGNAPYSEPQNLIDFINSGTVGQDSDQALTQNGNNSAGCHLYVRRCPAGQSWAGGTNANAYGICSVVADPCDELHQLETRGDLSHWCIDIPENQCTPGNFYNHDTSQCELPEEECDPGESWDPMIATCRETCSLDETYNHIEETCAQNCTGDDINHFITIAGEKSSWCGPDLDNPKPKDCQNVLGYVNDKQICGDAKDQCDAEGGTFGAVNGEEVCLPSDYGDDLPTCEAGTFMVSEDGGGFACEPVEKPDEPPEPEQPDESDIDDDGIPDKDDPDMDGDGIPNSEDGDIDGDGVANGDDGEPEGPGEEESSVSGGSCEERPSCKGDAVECATMLQVWMLRCEDGKAVLEGECGAEPTCEGDAVDCAILKSDWRTRCAGQEGAALQDMLSDFQAENSPARIDQGNEEFDQMVDDIFEQPETTSACPSPLSINLVGRDYTFQYEKFCAVAEQVRPVILMAASIIGFGILMRPF